MTALRTISLKTFMAREGAVAVIEIVGAKGSTPREEGALMLVNDSATLGTIGGGQLEFMAIDHARRLLRNGRDNEVLDIPLGPEIGQCCGGRVELNVARLTPTLAAALIEKFARAEAALPQVLVFGAGHVGRALAVALAPLPFRTLITDTRPDTLLELPDEVTTEVAALPEAIVRRAQPGSVFVVLTHDHALDFLIMREVLQRGDAAYAGMIGSTTKRTQFSRWFLGEGGNIQQLEGLTSPIGGKTGDKRAEVIASLVAAEIIVKTAKEQAHPRQTQEQEVEKGRG